MDLVHKVGRVARSQQRTPRVHVVQPSIKFLVAFQCNEEPALTCFELQAIWLQVYPFNIGHVAQPKGRLRWGCLIKTLQRERNQHPPEATHLALVD